MEKKKREKEGERERICVYKFCMFMYIFFKGLYVDVIRD